MCLGQLFAKDNDRHRLPRVIAANPLQLGEEKEEPVIDCQTGKITVSADKWTEADAYCSPWEIEVGKSLVGFEGVPVISTRLADVRDH